jgi:hypothetical protein
MSAGHVVSGGCQCGAVRYDMKVDRVEKPHVCHCRMCQRATGGLFAALAGCQKRDFVWTRGEPSFFASSSIADRGFCPDCGTPLSFAYRDPAARMYVTIGSLDDPSAAAIEHQFGTESKLPWVRFCEDVAGEETGASPDAAEFFKGMVNHQV